MNVPSRLTAEEFVTHRFDLPDGGRWVELVSGQVVTYEPPDDGHGTAVLNLSKTMSEYLHSEAGKGAGYACFGLGLILERRPDTVRFPQISFFTSGDRFQFTDAELTDSRPALVVEIASTNDRRRGLADRIRAYLDWGVSSVWVLDSREQELHVFRRGRGNETFGRRKTFRAESILPGLEFRIDSLFAEPKWWR